MPSGIQLAAFQLVAQLLKFVFFVAIMLVGYTGLADNSARECRLAFDQIGTMQTERIYGRDISFRRISSELLRQSKYSSKQLTPIDAVFIGIASNGHAYLLTGEDRFDGGLMFGDSLAKKSTVLDEGIVVRLDDPEGKLQQAIDDFMTNKSLPRGVSCVSSLCKLLGRSVSVNVPSEYEKTIFPNTLLKMLLTSELRDYSGRKHTVSVYVLGDNSLQSLRTRFINRTASEIGLKSIGLAPIGFTFARGIFEALSFLLS